MPRLTGYYLNSKGDYTIVHFHPVYFPVKQGMAYTCPLLWTKVKGLFFIETKIFQAREWSRVCVCGGSARDLSRAWIILVEIKNHPEIEVITEGRYTPYLASRDNILGGRVFYILTPSLYNCQKIYSIIYFKNSFGINSNYLS